ncbi:unnamed protein product [Rangifer tarandus platyrhynchus]|uniref:Uncharacterized protein n=1 Tax=Rangifer tarandus platyrhynchus TaxID=3082113 RepID=A0AC59ZNC5_RANTA
MKAQTCTDGEGGVGIEWTGVRVCCTVTILSEQSLDGERYMSQQLCSVCTVALTEPKETLSVAQVQRRSRGCAIRKWQGWDSVQIQPSFQSVFNFSIPCPWNRQL